MYKAVKFARQSKTPEDELLKLCNNAIPYSVFCDVRKAHRMH
jgi:hypothetical protein